MAYEIHPEKGLVNRGNWYRLKECMKRAEWGDRITLGFLGGSITQGSLSSMHTNCYAYLVFDWWVKKFPKTAFTYVNAGIGGTTSQFGAARVERDLMKSAPDAVFIEFSVNDENTEFFQETYEGLVRKVYDSPFEPAVTLIHNIMYDHGYSAQDMHQPVGEHYGIPCVSMKSTIYPEVTAGRIPNRDITPDDLHPNTEGHALVASVIIDFLEKVYAERDTEETKPAGLPAPMTANHYQNSVRYQHENAQVTENGFVRDTTVQKHIYDTARNGWIASHKGDSITFTIEGSELAVQYIKSVKQPAPIAQAVIDGDTEHAITLDANFEETWGDCLFIQSLMVHGEQKQHTVTITITETHEGDAVPFYLVSLIGSY